jgi:hypothetical protein
VMAFLADLGDALDGFVTGVEQFAASRQGTLGQHALLALEHGIAVHRASLEWVRSAMAALAAEPGGLGALYRFGTVVDLELGEDIADVVPHGLG